MQRSAPESVAFVHCRGVPMLTTNSLPNPAVRQTHPDSALKSSPALLRECSLAHEENEATYAETTPLQWTPRLEPTLRSFRQLVNPSARLVPERCPRRLQRCRIPR